jgi:hypothetical protein
MTTDTAMPIMLSGALYREINSITNMAIELQQVKQVGSVMNIKFLIGSMVFFLRALVIIGVVHQ